jgi:uncharacterized protein
VTSFRFPRRVFVDSSAIYASVGRRDPNHEYASAVDRELRRSNVELITTNFIVAEAHALILGRENRVLALDTLRRIDRGGLAVIRIEVEEELAARSIIERYTDKDFSLVDATSFVIMDALGLRTAFAFDVNFRQYGFETL